jgi:hypothetical protein
MPALPTCRVKSAISLIWLVLELDDCRITLIRSHDHIAGKGLRFLGTCRAKCVRRWRTCQALLVMAPNFVPCAFCRPRVYIGVNLPRILQYSFPSNFLLIPHNRALPFEHVTMALLANTQAHALMMDDEDKLQDLRGQFFIPEKSSFGKNIGKYLSVLISC